MLKKISIFLLCLFLSGPSLIQAADDLVLGGDSIGIQINYDGVMVSGTYAFEIDGISYDQSNRIQPKDIIQTIGGVRIHTITDLYEQLNTFQNKINEVDITLLRNNENIDTTLITVLDEEQGAYKSGLYVKDKIAGVGTMTYYDPSTRTYGALGHEIFDVDIKQIAQVYSGSIFPANVTSIQKAQNNIPGEKHAQIDYTMPLGSVKGNNQIGIYGFYDKLPKEIVKIPWAKQSEVHTGTATIYTVLDKQKIESFEIKITKLNTQDHVDIKGIEFIVSDERLKSLTNGIIQGMSGSPIVQDGKIIGAVTHVVTSNPMNGYGVYIEWMLEKSSALKQ